LQADADVYVISPRVTPILREWAEAGHLQLTEREAEQSDLAGAALVFAATNRPDINHWIAEIAGNLGVPVNIADEGERSDFLTPAVVRRGGLVLTASTSGAGPALAAQIIQELADRYGPEYKEYVEALRAIRAVVKAEVTDSSERRALLQAAVTDEALTEWRTASWLQDKDMLLNRLRQRALDLRG
jgi:precorrin-2 dehydrogenase/sirohydrochlorin ferrochelatase